jgi:hypothetical protein
MADSVAAVGGIEREFDGFDLPDSAKWGELSHFHDHAEERRHSRFF